MIKAISSATWSVETLEDGSLGQLDLYKVWKVWEGRNRFRVECDGEVLGYAANERGAELLIEADKVEKAMYGAPSQSRERPKTFKGVAID
jgi:hypothetical protein